MTATGQHNPVSPVAAPQPLAPSTQGQPRVGSVVRLGHNERTVPLPEEAVREMFASINPEVLTAVPELGVLYEKLSSYLKVPSDCLLICHGSDAGIADLFRLTVGVRDEVIQPHPTYHRYLEFCEFSGATPVLIGYDSDFQLRCRELRDRINPHTKLVIIVNPGSPTGLSVSIEYIKEVLIAARRHGALVLVDEAYHHYCEVTATPLLAAHSNLVVTRTFSKAWGIAGLRVGVVMGDRGVISGLRKLKPRHEISSVSALITEYLLDHPNIMEEYVAEVARSRPLTVQALAAVGYVAVPGESAAMLVRVPSELKPVELKQALMLEGYEVAAGLPHPFEQYMRVSVGPWNQMVAFVSALADVTHLLVSQ